MAEQLEKQKTGTTNVVVTYDGGVVLGAEQKATMGYLESAKNVRKVFQIDDSIGMTIAGSIGDVQTIVRYLRSETKLYNLQRDYHISVNATATLLANILQGSKYFPYMGQFIVGGYDSDGPRAVSLDPVGGMIAEEPYQVAGSGTPYALGVLEDQYEEGMDEKTAISLVARALTAAKRRDIASGGHDFTIAVIDEDGYRELDEEEIEDYK